jgi:hypothetical protein
MRDGGYVLKAGTRNTPNTQRAYGFWALDEARELQPNAVNTNWFRWPTPATDPYYSYVVQLSHFQPEDIVALVPGAPINGGAIKDYSSSGTQHMIPTTQVANSQTAFLTPDAPLWGTTVGFINSSGANGWTPALKAPFGYGTGDFCIEFWMYYNTIGTVNILDQRTAAFDVAPTIYTVAGGSIIYNVAGTDYITGGAGTISTGSWFHHALARTAGTTGMYVSGTRIGTFADSFNYLQGNGPTFGGPYLFTTSNSMLLGETRVTVGSGRGYTGATIAVPTQPFPDL